MAPLLLDQRGLIKTGFFLCLSFAVVFFGGYYTGYDKGYGHAEIYSEQRAPVPVALVLPEPAYADIDVFEPQPPAVIEPGADIDVDRPDEAGTNVLASESTDSAPPQSRVEAEISDAGFRAQTPSPPVQVASLEVTPEVVADVTAVSVLASNASPAEAKYSIQVGMYGSTANARLLLETLNATRLDAYIDEFTNAQDKARFNVRFGFYRDRASAKAALAYYRSQLDGEGYVVRVDD